jgi:hypothetical protein
MPAELLILCEQLAEMKGKELAMKMRLLQQEQAGGAQSVR